MTPSGPRRPPMVDEARLRTRVIRYLKEQDGEYRTVDDIAGGTGLSPQEVRAGIDHNHFVDNLRPNLYYGVIQKRQNDDRASYRFNKVQYVQNRSRWIDAGKRGRKGGRDGGQQLTLPKPGRMFGWLRRRGK